MENNNNINLSVENKIKKFKDLVGKIFYYSDDFEMLMWKISELSIYYPTIKNLVDIKDIINNYADRLNILQFINIMCKQKNISIIIKNDIINKYNQILFLLIETKTKNNLYWQL